MKRMKRIVARYTCDGATIQQQYNPYNPLTKKKDIQLNDYEKDKSNEEERYDSVSVESTLRPARRSQRDQPLDGSELGAHATRDNPRDG